MRIHVNLSGGRRAVLFATLTIGAGIAACSSDTNQQPPTSFTTSSGSGATTTSSAQVGTGGSSTTTTAGSTTVTGAGGATVSSTSGATVTSAGGATSTSATATGAGGGQPDCKGTNDCYKCAPKTEAQFLNACTDSQCSPFDNVARLPLYNNGNLPAIP